MKQLYQVFFSHRLALPGFSGDSYCLIRDAGKKVHLFGHFDEDGNIVKITPKLVRDNSDDHKQHLSLSIIEGGHVVSYSFVNKGDLVEHCGYDPMDGSVKKKGKSKKK